VFLPRRDAEDLDERVGRSRATRWACNLRLSVTGNDHGWGEQAVDDALHEAGIRNVNIPARADRAKPDKPKEHRRAFRRHVKWRTGCEGRISTLKRGYGWDVSRIGTLEGARTWVGHGVLTHNLIKIAALTN
jgi:IS5 family transposase